MNSNIVQNLSGKNEKEIAAMFDSISPSYDFLNHFLSFGTDTYWRQVCVKEVARIQPEKILDIATGTGDLAIKLAKKLNKASITGVDISGAMLGLAQKKIKKRKLEDRIVLNQASVLSLPFDNSCFDAVTVAFGVRNFEDIDKAFSEVKRVLKPGGMLYVLEFSKPSNRLVFFVYNLYFSYILPWLGKLFSGHKYAYRYLNRSASLFPSGKTFENILRKNNFEPVSTRPLTFGIATFYVGKTP
ncbi:MAG: Demethylmenaquinone methyltransferase [Bacteroidetes bacterium ADurb.Bin408]|nr:MAG: Demethylmenaquinone methyltransferase [Bacteroidetes bacterium ADurb.Bin408]